ncbi:hypothetical protein COCON_G00206140 [Conger conger]|uniref:Uncharacterized protein n=1 Tax=Conger conger TaxID=82655 RepID=A0A9Q1HPI3_CONCO|nr:stabilizer of axonemal microtubules 1-like [Conger conger]KAJ8254002.1 hypothetical protein COCON_G00206140 [Conger conger]
MDIQSVYSEYRRWVNGKPDRFSGVNSFWPSCTGSSSTATVTLNATATSQPGRPQPGPSSIRSQSTAQPQPEPEIREFRRNEDAFNYRRFSKFASKRRDASKPENSDSDSIHQQDYRSLWGRPAMSARPPDHLKVSTCPFVAITEYQDQYRAWQVPPSYRRRDTASRPTQKMDLRTSYAQDFKGLQGDLTASARPPDNLRVSVGPFGVSSSKMHQKEWLVPPPQRYKPENVPPQGKIDFSTSYGQAFKAQEGSMRFLILPRDHIHLSQGVFPGKTTYTADFSPMRTRAL